MNSGKQSMTKNRKNLSQKNLTKVISLKSHSHNFKISFLPLITYLLLYVTKTKKSIYIANNLIITNSEQFFKTKIKNRPFI